MRKTIGLFVMVGILMSAGVASADRAFWFSDTANSWVTFFNVQNMGASQDATVTFFNQDGSSLGSTTATLAANENWNFSTSGLGSINVTTMDAATRGAVIISGTTAGEIKGHVSIFNTVSNSGFQMRIHTVGTDDGSYDW